MRRVTPLVRRLSASAVARGKVVLADGVDPAAAALLRARGHEVSVLPGSAAAGDVAGASALVVRSGTAVTDELLAAAGDSLQVVARAGTGVDNVDVRAATARGVVVTSAPGGNAASAAEMALAMLLSLSRVAPAPGGLLRGKTLGVVGLGRTGRDLAGWAAKLGMRVVGADPILSGAAARSAGIEAVSLAELWARADVVSLHTPLTRETRGLVDAEALAACRPGVCLVNCSRGEVVDEAALVAALESGHVRAAALDVFAQEPPPADSPLLRMPNVVATPHLGGSTRDAQARVAAAAAAQVADVLDGAPAPVPGAVNFREPATSSAFDALAERLGSMQAQLLLGAKLHRVLVRAVGADVGSPAATDALVAAALTGVLRELLEEDVGRGNAQALAAELGLEVRVQRERSGAGSLHRNTVSVVLETDAGSGARSLTGTVLGLDQLRVTEVDGFPVDFAPAGDLVLFRNEDRPGVLRAVMERLAAGGHDAAEFSLGRVDGRARALGIVAVSPPAPAELLEGLPGLEDVACVSLAAADFSAPVRSPEQAGQPRTKPDPHFGSGPCKKRPGYSLAQLDTAALGRSHRSALGQARLRRAIDQSKALLELPAGYELGLVPGSDTGAFEMAMWNLLGPERPVDVCYWDAFGKQWFADATQQLRLPHVRELRADYGQLPDLAQVSPRHDVCFTWNGTTAGVRVPDADWIAADREGLTLCDATSAAFAMDLDWPKLDVATFSFQKVLGGEGGHGVVVLGPRALERLEAGVPGAGDRALPKVLRLDRGVFRGATINTPSMLVVEDYLDALDWAARIGGLPELTARSRRNLAVLERFVERNEWARFLAADPATRSSTSVCLRLDCAPEQLEELQALLARHGVAYDIGAYRDAPAGLRIWCGATVEEADLEKLVEWMEWGWSVVVSV